MVPLFGVNCSCNVHALMYFFCFFDAGGFIFTGSHKICIDLLDMSFEFLIHLGPGCARVVAFLREQIYCMDGGCLL